MSIHRPFFSIRRRTAASLSTEIPVERHAHNMLFLPINDDDPREDITRILPEALSVIEDVKRRREAGDTQRRVLVHCRSGASRAVCVTLAALVHLENMTITDAYYYVLHRRPQAANVFPAYLRQMEAWAAEHSRLRDDLTLSQ
jgi:protein-tyrosine phosphatase